MKKEIQPITILKIVAILVLFWGLAPNPYFYYQLQRWLMCSITAYCAYKAYENHQIPWSWIFGIIAVIFNPIAPIYLNRETWSVIDVMTAVMIFISMFNMKLLKKYNQ